MNNKIEFIYIYFRLEIHIGAQSTEHTEYTGCNTVQRGEYLRISAFYEQNTFRLIIMRRNALLLFSICSRLHCTLNSVRLWIHMCMFVVNAFVKFNDYFIFFHLSLHSFLKWKNDQIEMHFQDREPSLVIDSILEYFSFQITYQTFNVRSIVHKYKALRQSGISMTCTMYNVRHMIKSIPYKPKRYHSLVYGNNNLIFFTFYNLR